MPNFMAGNLKCHVLDVGYVVSNLQTIFSNAPEDAAKAELVRLGMDSNGIVFPMHPLVVETSAGRVLIDPGNMPDNPNGLLNALQGADIDPATISTVIITHGHADHWGGCIRPGGALAFPQAVHVMGRIEWEFWKTPDNPEPMHADRFKYLLPHEANFRLVDDGEEIVPGIQAVLTPGHSPGHMALLIGGEVICVGDAIFHLLTVGHPEWVAIFERFPDQVVEARFKLLQRLSDEHLRAVVYHFGDPCVGRVVAEGDRFAWVAE